MLLVMGACAPVAWGQDWDDWDDYDSYVPERKGIEFALNFGVYQGHHKAANEFYSGISGEIYELSDPTANLMTNFTRRKNI